MLVDLHLREVTLLECQTEDFGVELSREGLVFSRHNRVVQMHCHTSVSTLLHARLVPGSTLPRLGHHCPKVWSASRNLSGTLNAKATCFVERQVPFVESLEIARQTVGIGLRQHGFKKRGTDDSFVIRWLYSLSHEIPVRSSGQPFMHRFYTRA